MNYRASKGMIANEAFPFALIAATAAIVMWLVGWEIPAVICFFALVFVLAFFRNPERYHRRAPNAVISGADGKISAAGLESHPDFPDGQCLRIAVFMSVFDVHINWAPVAGAVISAEHITGCFMNAMHDKCADENERKVIHMRTPEGHLVIVKLIAGLIARRIVCPIEEGDQLAQGDKIGLIRFGSRVEVLLPSSSALHVRPGMMVRGGETVLATLPGATP